MGYRQDEQAAALAAGFIWSTSPDGERQYFRPEFLRTVSRHKTTSVTADDPAAGMVEWECTETPRKLFELIGRMKEASA